MSLLIISTPHQYIAVPSNSISKRSPRFQGHSMRFRRLSLPIFASPPLFFASRFRCFSLQVNATRSLSDALPLTSLPRSAVPSRLLALLFPRASSQCYSHTFLRCALALLGRASPFPRFSALLRFIWFHIRSIRFLSSPLCSFSRLSSPLHGLGWRLRFRAEPCFSDSERGVRCVSLARHSAS